MFPNIPRAYIIRELDRADGVVAVAIDNLIPIASDFINFNATDSTDRLVTTPMIERGSSTHHNILKTLDEPEEMLTSSSKMAAVLNRKNWDKIDEGSRKRILSERKREMIMKARECFINKHNK